VSRKNKINKRNQEENIVEIYGRRVIKTKNEAKSR